MIVLQWEHSSYKRKRNHGKFCGFEDEWVSPYPNPSALKNGGVTAKSHEPRYTEGMAIRASERATKRPKRIIDQRPFIGDLEFVAEDEDVAPMYAPIRPDVDADRTQLSQIILDESFGPDGIEETKTAGTETQRGGAVFFGSTAALNMVVAEFGADNTLNATVVTDTSEELSGIAIRDEIFDGDFTTATGRGLDDAIDFASNIPGITGVTLGRHLDDTILQSGGETARGGKNQSLRNIPEFKAAGFAFAKELDYPDTSTQLIAENAVGASAFLLKMVVKFSKAAHGVDELVISLDDFLDGAFDASHPTSAANITLYPSGRERVETFWFNSVIGTIKKARCQFGVQSVAHAPRLGMAVFGMQSGCDVRSGGGGIEAIHDEKICGYTTGHVLAVQAFFTV